MPHQALEKKTPEEIFTGGMLDISHLHVFGCLVYFHVLKDKRNKLEATRRKGTFVGYCENSRAYRIYIPGQRKVEISRDVTFDEDAALGKARYIPPPPPPKEENDDWDILDGSYPPKSDMVDDPIEPMDFLDPPPSDPPCKKRLVWLRDMLPDIERNVPIHR